MQSNLKDTIKYWGIKPPMVFEELSYEEKRKFRYELQDYMLDFYRYQDFAGKTVLEIGSGGGIDSAEFSRNGAIITSMDFTEIGTKITKDLAKNQVTRCSATLIPFKINTFDAVYSFGVIHHIPDIESVLSEIWRVLKQGGIFMGMVYNKDSLLYAYLMYYFGVKKGLLKTMNEEQLISYASERREGCPYTKAYTAKEFSDLLQDNWFSHVETQIFYNAFDIPEYKRKIKFQLDDEINLGWHIGFKCRK